MGVAPDVGSGEKRGFAGDCLSDDGFLFTADNQEEGVAGCNQGRYGQGDACETIRSIADHHIGGRCVLPPFLTGKDGGGVAVCPHSQKDEVEQRDAHRRKGQKSGEQCKVVPTRLLRKTFSHNTVHMSGGYLQGFQQQT